MDIICQHCVVHSKNTEISDTVTKTVEGGNSDSNDNGIERAVWKR